MKTVTLGDIEVAYVESGQGKPVVFLHGLAEGLGTWKNQQSELSDWHTFAYDLRGHGNTTVGEANGTLEQLGGDLVAFLEKVSGPAAVVGFSLGGTIALWAAAKRPDLVTNLIVMGTSSVVGRRAAPFYDSRIALAADTRSEAFKKALHEDSAAALVVEKDQLESVVAARLAVVGDGKGYINAAEAMKALITKPLGPLLTSIKLPVTVVGGSDDAFCPYKAAEIIMESLSDAVYREIPNAGHLMNIDNPGAVTEVLRTALK